MRSFILSFDAQFRTRDEVTRKINSISEIVNWLAFFDGSVILTSNLDSKDLADLIRSRLPGLRFIVQALEPSRPRGWLPRSVWEFINDPKPVEGEAESARPRRGLLTS